jgi:hypothetical protein
MLPRKVCLDLSARALLVLSICVAAQRGTSHVNLMLQQMHIRAKSFGPEVEMFIA